MSSLVLSGDTSGAITVSAPATAGTNTITLGANTGVNILDANTPAFRNRIINGGFVIDQRNAGASVTPTNAQYTLDRWVANLSQASKFSVQQNAGSVTPPAGFTNYLGVTSLSAYTVGSGDYFAVRQAIEGFNAADLAWGTANAKTITLSFWVRSSLTGTFGGGIVNYAGTRSYPYTYTISSANTWEQKTITISGDTTGTWTTSNSGWGFVQFGLGVGSTYSGTAGAWAGANYLSATGGTSVVGTNGATFYITGVQLEVGSTATSFDYRPYTTELQLAQRYFTKFGSGVAFEAYSMGEAITTTSIRFLMQCPVVMRGSPTLTVGGSGLVWSLDRVGTALSSFSLAQATTQIQSITANTANTITVGQMGSVTAGNYTNTSISFSSEL